MRIGWIGLGSVGTEMVKRALAAGHSVNAYARGAGTRQAEAAGASLTNAYQEVAAECEILGVCVYRDEQLRDVLLDQGVLAAMRPGAIVAIHTTGSPDLARELGARAPAGIGVLDATFSGGPSDAAAGRLALMVGGETEVIERARPLLRTYADRIHTVGPLGQGQVLKLLNNLLFAANLQNAIEILHIAERQGLDTKVAARILQDCSGASYASALFSNAPVDLIRRHTQAYLAKDVPTALASARASGIDTTPFAGTEAYFAAPDAD